MNTLAQSKAYNWLWLVGLTIGTLAVITIAVIFLKKFRSWLKSDVSVSSSNIAFDLHEIKKMRDKGLISNEEYSQLREAQINSK